MSIEDDLRHILEMKPCEPILPKFYEDYWQDASWEARAWMLPPTAWPGHIPAPTIADYQCIEHRMPATTCTV